jgi:serine/threonine protein kinase
MALGPMPLASGTRLGPYEITGTLGAGGMGEVYRAKDSRLGRDVAVKVLPAVAVADAERMRRFETEAKATSALNHPTLLAVHDFGRADGVPYLVTELLEGETVRERLANGPISPRKGVDIAVQIAQGLAAAHEKGVVHRDLKPENLFVLRDGRVKILDFGVAKLMASTQGSGSDAAFEDTVTPEPGTQTGSVLGTAAYMAPEQIRGRAIDHRADIFSFGVILFELLTGTRPFKGDSRIEVAHSILKEEPEELPPVKDAPPLLATLIRRCLEKNPEERFQSARDVAFDLQMLTGFSQTTGTGAVPALPPSRAWRLPAAIVLAVAMAIGAFVAGRLGRHSTQAAAATLDDPASAPAALSFERLTFRRGFVANARFAPDGHSVVFMAFWGSPIPQIFSAQIGAPGVRALSDPGYGLMALSSQGTLAVATGTDRRR